MSVMQVIVLLPYTKFEVYSPSHSEDTADFRSHNTIVHVQYSSGITTC